MPYIFVKFTFRISWSSAESWNRIQDLKTYSKYSLYQPKNMNVLTQNAANKIVEMRALLHWCSFLIWNSVVFSSSQAYREFNHTAGPHFSNYPHYPARSAGYHINLTNACPFYHFTTSTSQSTPSYLKTSVTRVAIQLLHLPIENHHFLTQHQPWEASTAIQSC